MPYDLHPKAAAAIDKRTRDLLLLVKVYRLQFPEPPFPTERPVDQTLSPDRFAAPPVYEVRNSKGAAEALYFGYSGHVYGIAGEDFRAVRLAAELVQKTPWAKAHLSYGYIEKLILEWCRLRITAGEPRSFAALLLSKAASDIQSYRVLVPIAMLEVEHSFNFGDVKVISLHEEYLTELEANCNSLSKEGHEDVAVLFAHNRARFQGLAAIESTILGESEQAVQVALDTARDAIGLLRFFSPAAYLSLNSCHCDVFGSELSQQTVAIAISQTSFAQNERVTTQPGHWFLSSTDLKRSQEGGLHHAGILLSGESRTEYQTKLRSSLLRYSKGLTFPDDESRLIYTFSALESFLIRTDSEPIQQNLSERMAFLVTEDAGKRRDIVSCVKKVYGFRSRFAHHGISVDQDETLEQFTFYAWSALLQALLRIEEFSTTTDLLNDLDRIKFGG